MRPFLFVSALLTLFLGCTSQQPAPQPTVKKEIKDVSFQARGQDSGPRKRLMVLPFLDEKEERPQSMRDMARRDFIKELNRTGEIIAIDSSELNLDLGKLVSSKEYDLAQVAKAANNMGVSALLEGKVIDLKMLRQSDAVGVFREMKTRFEATVRVRVVVAKSAREILNVSKTVSLEQVGTRVAESVSTDALIKTNPELLEKLVSDAFIDFQPQVLSALAKLAWEGRIALINGDRIFLNVGRISGLQLGDILKVSNEGEDVYDPQTGNFIGKTPGRLKGTLEVVSYFGQDGTIAIIHSGAGFKENDKVELY